MEHTAGIAREAAVLVSGSNQLSKEGELFNWVGKAEYCSVGATVVLP